MQEHAPPQLSDSTILGRPQAALEETEQLIDAPIRDWRFWLSFLAICISMFIAALEMVRHCLLPYS
jgi:hypothetical protein